MIYFRIILVYFILNFGNLIFEDFGSINFIFGKLTLLFGIYTPFFNFLNCDFAILFHPTVSDIISA